jgi:isoquinoline 1-oxidoreductase subunit beta
MATDPTMDPSDGPPARPRRRLARRAFLISAGLVGTGLLVGAGYVSQQRAKNKNFKLGRPVGGGGSFGAWITIDNRNNVVVFCPHQEMGQGIMSLTASLVAEELDADPATMTVLQAPVTAAYANALLLLDGLPLRDDDTGMLATVMRAASRHVVEAVGINGTGGSTGARNVVDAVQRCAAMARSMLLEAAAKRLSVPTSELRIEAGIVRHASRPDTFKLGDLAEQASWLEPREAPPKPRASYRLLGKTGMPRLDVPSKVDGSALFGIDVRLPGQLYAAVRQSPHLGATVQAVTWPAKNAAIKGTVQTADFVAAIATGWWAAKQFVEAAGVTWTSEDRAGVNSAAVLAQMSRAVTNPSNSSSHVFETRGDPRTTVPGGIVVEATYHVPFLAHATMEPMNATAVVRPATAGAAPACEVWCGNQGPLLLKWTVADAAGVKSDDLGVNTPLLGGGFGRRIEMDVPRMAATIAQSMPGVPVQTIWSREDDMRHDMYRPLAVARMTAELDATGLPVTLRAHASCASVASQFMKRLANLSAPAASDRANVDGLTHLPYGIPHLEIRHTAIDSQVPVGFWRSVGHSQNAFFAECFIDECAAAAQQDPLAYRLALLKRRTGDPIAQRAIKLLTALAEKAAWRGDARGTRLESGARLGRGVALAESFRSVVAQVADVVVDANGKLVRVQRVLAAVDCGFALDPVNVTAQVRGAIHFGLTAALYGRIDIDKGTVKQGNFNDYRLLSLADAPAVEVMIVSSDGPLGGIGEVGVPPIAPAVANAVFAATGVMPRSLPLLA